MGVLTIFTPPPPPHTHTHTRVETEMCTPTDAGRTHANTGGTVRYSHLLSLMFLSWGSAHAEIKALSTGNPELSNLLEKPGGVDHNIAMYATLPTARNSEFLFTAFQVHSTSFLPFLLKHGAE